MNVSCVKNSVNFSGWRRFPSGLYHDDEIQLARKYVGRHDDWQAELLEERIKSAKIRNKEVLEEEDEDQPLVVRALSGLANISNPIMSVAMRHVRLHRENVESIRAWESYVEHVANLVEDLRAGHKGKFEKGD